ncbi:hypothetical protein DL765_007184 [Monosporascus sp. GIB2]|nr:hypothetical protein DL765_007184 [Monosporascus sp. GIB2]
MRPTVHREGYPQPIVGAYCLADVKSPVRFGAAQLSVTTTTSVQKPAEGYTGYGRPYKLIQFNPGPKKTKSSQDLPRDVTKNAKNTKIGTSFLGYYIHTSLHFEMLGIYQYTLIP